jgi:16S rRNA (cytosine967-C5)-methyltransferase
LTYGCARWLGFIDAVLGLVLDRPITAVDGEALDILRLGTFELLVNNEPPHVVNEWVQLTKSKAPRATGFVNATLRAVSRLSPDQWLHEIEHSLRGAERIVALTSHPEWIVRSYEEVLGVDETRELVDINNTPAIPMMVALPGLAQVPSDAVRSEMSPYAFSAPQGNISTTPGLREGRVRVQDEGSQIAALLLGRATEIAPGEQWLDLCAGPGGKSALLAALLAPHNGVLWANEPHAHRAELVRQALKPFGDSIRLTSLDGRDAAREFPAGFSRVLVDAPCSGIGALRRRPEARWRKHEDDLAGLTRLQTELLESAIDAVEVGGLVAYVTCSPDKRETVDVVEAVVVGRTDIELIDTSKVFDSITSGVDGARRGSAVQLWPQRHNTDAMFIQLVKRTG